MKDAKEIRRELWRSLDMVWVRYNAVILLLLFGGFGLWFAFIGWQQGDWQTTGVMLTIMSLALAPFLVFDLYRTYRIFQSLESYTFCRCCLSNPKGGAIRDSIKFTVVIQDADGNKFAADTHSIFQTHGAAGLLLEEYVNKTVTVAYNEDTGMVVVIG